MHLKTLIKSLLKKTSLYKFLRFSKYKTTTYFDKRRRVSGNHQFTVVSAVYNVEKYLDEYFESIVNQTLKFEDHIHLIMVDDGSPDDSANIIKKWQGKYPDNITYIKKENGGQASARNLGMEYVQTEWVTFIDPDDFLDYRYFEEVDNFLIRKQKQNIGLVSCNYIFYYEDEEKFSDSHPLKYRFSKPETIFQPDDLKDHIQLSMNSVIFNNDLLHKYKLHCHNIKPNFEDGHFVNRFLTHCKPQHMVAFLKKPIYYYRKRADETSALDTSWQKKEKFIDVLELGYIDLLEYVQQQKGFIPQYIQRTVLYDITWHFKYLLNQSTKINFLSDKEKEEYKILLKKIFTYIDEETIDNFNLSGFWFYHKVAVMGMFKGSSFGHQRVYIEEYDPLKNEIFIRYFSHFDSTCVIEMNGKIIKPTHHKIRRHDFVGDLFVNEYRMWILIKDQRGFSMSIDNKPTTIVCGKTAKLHNVSMQKIIQCLKPTLLDISKLSKKVILKRELLQSLDFKKKFKNAWILMDRDTQADDNAEHFYRYLRKEHPEVNIFFVLRKNSHDWQRLKKDGFKLIPFDSLEYEALLIHTKHLISSHADTYITHYFNHNHYDDLLQYKYTFLQHGIIQNDLSYWLNFKKIDLFITSVQREYNSIIADYSPYKFTTKEVKLTGLPRHDILLGLTQSKKKSILIMPTWRQHLVGKTRDKSNDREYNDTFTSTDFYKSWKSVLHSPKLKKIHKEMDVEILFFLHANIQQYFHLFEVPSYIKDISHNTASIQQLFANASMMLTDYSSVAFEMAILKKPILYYQFDYDDVFGGKHLTSKGYFDYEKDAFGSIVYDEEKLFSDLETIVNNNFNLEEKYTKRIEKFFTYFDTSNCQRVYEAIQRLDNK